MIQIYYLYTNMHIFYMQLDISQSFFSKTILNSENSLFLPLMGTRLKAWSKGPLSIIITVAMHAAQLRQKSLSNQAAFVGQHDKSA